MGYNMHITRAREWSANRGHEIRAEEWLAYVAGDPELSLDPENGPYFATWRDPAGAAEQWIDWKDGDIFSKYPDQALIRKMEAIAALLGASVQGDEGERYRDSHAVAERPSRWERVRRWFHYEVPQREEAEPAAPFVAGDRVLDVFHREATILEIVPESSTHLGKVTVRYDDGQQATFAYTFANPSVFPVRCNK